MAYDFGSDILVDAMRAADPAQAAQTAQRLRAISAGRAAGPPEEAAFKTQLDRTDSEVKTHRNAEVLRKFESAVLTTFIQAMMPKEATSVYGEGLAGDMWKSKMAETIAEQLSLRGGIGIANRLLKDFSMEGDKVVPLAGAQDASVAPQVKRAEDQVNSYLTRLESVVLEKLSGASDQTIHNAESGREV